MARKRVLTDEQLFEAFFLIREKLKSTRKVENLFKKKGVPISYKNISVWVTWTSNKLATDESFKQKYEDWKQGKTGTKVFLGKDDKGRYFSEYETVQSYINRALAELQGDTWIEVLNANEHIWKFLRYKDPANWNQNDLNRFLAYGKNRRGTALTPNNKVDYVTKARAIAPNLKAIDGLTTPHKKHLRKTVKIKKSPIFVKEYFQIARDPRLSEFNRLVFRCHTILGAREGSKPADIPASILGLDWSHYHPENNTFDVYESKAVGWWKRCPLDVFDKDFPEDFKQYWINQGSPKQGNVFNISYHDLKKIYAEIRYLHNLPRYFTPHFARKTHTNILAELGYGLENIAGDPWEGKGTLGVGWKTIDVMRQYYLAISPTRLDEEHRKAKDKLRRFYL